jgi:hypothetical protein
MARAQLDAPAELLHVGGARLRTNQNLRRSFLPHRGSSKTHGATVANVDPYDLATLQDDR